MPPVPSVRGERIVRALEKAGFKVARVTGRDHIMRHPNGAARRSRCTKVAMLPKEHSAGLSPTSA